MDYDAFLNKYPQGTAIDWDGMYGPQCVDLVAQYCADNGKPVAYANAKDWWQNPALTDAFDFIANDPNDPNQLPSRGNIVIFNGNQPGSGGYGHIDIFDMVTGANTWQGYDQNWGAPYAKFVPNHVWTYVIGWMVPKAPPAPPVQPAPPADNTPYPAPEPAPSPQPDPTPVVTTDSNGTTGTTVTNPLPAPEPTPSQVTPSDSTESDTRPQPGNTNTSAQTSIPPTRRASGLWRSLWEAVIAVVRAIVRRKK